MSLIGAKLQIGLYDPSESEEAMRLEARSPQGKAFRLRFHRSYFHRRAENFDWWKLVTARSAGALIGIGAGALKPAYFEGRETIALYLFDVRVAPEYRRAGIAQRLLQELILWAGGAAEIAYAHVAGDNDAASRLAREWIGADAAPACRYLVYPVYRAGRGSPDIAPVPAEAVHRQYLEREGPFGLYCPPSDAFASEAYIGSWAFESGASAAACSAWSNEEIMGEVVERIPWPLGLAGALSRTWPASLIPAPRLPRRGERVRSWYLFDFHAADDSSALALMSGVAAEARRRGVDYCYIIHRGSEAWIEALRRQVPRLFAPIIPYSLLARRLTNHAPLQVHAPYIDIRDV